MFTILFVGLVAACAAAPHFHHRHLPFHDPSPETHIGFGKHNPFSEEFFDTKQFWADMAREMRELDAMLTQFYEKFPPISSTQGIVGNEYKITIPLSGFEESEVVVKAREGVLMVQAVHKLPEGQRSYLDIKTLPKYVNVTGAWTLENEILNIVFPLKPDAETEAPVTEHSREDLAPSGEDTEGANSNADADINVVTSREPVLEVNEIPRNSIEATTYAVDLKDEVEFVPVRY